MKVAMVSMNAGPLTCLGADVAGGQSVVVDELARGLSLLGHQITVYTQRNGPAWPRWVTTPAGVRVKYVDVAAAPGITPPALTTAIDAFSARLGAEWTIEPPDIVHAHFWTSGKAALPATTALGIPLVQTFYGLEPKRHRDARDGGPQRCIEEAALVRAVAQVIAMSSAEVFTLMSMGAHPGAIKLIPCGVDAEVFTPRPTSAAALTAPLRVATLGRLGLDDGVADVIDALRYVDGVELVIGGGRFTAAQILDDPDAQALRRLAEARGVAQRIAFHGRVERRAVASFLHAADVVVCTPRHASTGALALEAMSCGVPVIVSCVGSLIDAVADGMTGLHVRPNAPRQLAYAIDTLKTNPAQRRRLGRFGVERTRARYGWPHIAAQTQSVYAGVVARGTRDANHERVTASAALD